MTDRPILFSAPMIRALLDGRKTQTRRVLKPQPSNVDGVGRWYRMSSGGESLNCYEIPITPGDRVWVRETWNVPDAYLEPRNRQTALELMNYAATPWAIPGRWRPSIFMPRWASRLTLTVTDVRVQRVQEISEADAMAEGIKRNIPGWFPVPGIDGSGTTARAAFAMLWDSLNAKRGFGWSENPWIAAYTFTVHHCNIDQMEVPK
ncbi:hypothetical protein [Roseovarius sp.]|uniref:hypothetical protein n=1 Tax=Roseovarius sp. TaxID=1486281 RepID=UPI003BABE347